MQQEEANFDIPVKKSPWQGLISGFTRMLGRTAGGKYEYDADDSCLFQGGREYQQDAVWLSPVQRDRVCGMVADGMGGMKNGGACSQKAKDKFIEFYQQIRFENIPESLVRFVNLANTAVFELNGKEEIGGTTFACVLIYRDELYWVSTGDSNIFLLRKGQLAMLNAEHELENQLYIAYMKDMLDIDDIHSTSNGNLRKLTSYLGREYAPKCDYNLRPLKLETDDRILICSDGISGTLAHEEIITALSLPTAAACGQELARMVEAVQKPNQDNYSAVVLCYNPEERE